MHLAVGAAAAAAHAGWGLMSSRYGDSLDTEGVARRGHRLRDGESRSRRQTSRSSSRTSDRLKERIRSQRPREQGGEASPLPSGVPCSHRTRKRGGQASPPPSDGLRSQDMREQGGESSSTSSDRLCSQRTREQRGDVSSPTSNTISVDMFFLPEGTTQIHDVGVLIRVCDRGTATRARSTKLELQPGPRGRQQNAEDLEVPETEA